ncbi:MAG: hypothetical protein RH942_14400 [Kiloniellaceae bacterium]
MSIRYLFCITVVGALLAAGGFAQAQNRSVLLKAPPPGQTEFPACCDSCNSNGCTGCNSGPEGLNCGTGLIKAECTVTNNEASCKEDKSRPGTKLPGKLKAN